MSSGQSADQPRPGTAGAIARTLEERIRAGRLAVGERLPTVRAYAAQMRVDKNTVARAYKLLEQRGYLSLTRGRGAFVLRRHPEPSDVVGAWQARLEGVLKEARAGGLNRDAVLRGALASLDRVFGKPGPRLAFIECNQPDIDTLGHFLSVVVERPLQGILLERALAEPEALTARFDLIVTTFNHLSEVSRALDRTAKEKIVGVQSMPTHDALLRIARLHAMVIGFVYELPRVGDEFTYTIKTYHPNATILPVSINDRAQLRALLKKADAIVVTQMCEARLSALKPGVPVVLLSTTVDQQSVDFLRQRIAALDASLAEAA
jgi:DNA-binding transcriptional regulator YhcF (GntR family)